MRLRLDVSAGELVDRITILELKVRRLESPQRGQVARDLARARYVRDMALTPSPLLWELTDALRAINLQLWEVEEELRKCELRQDFGPRFIALARKVYLNNDKRAALKRKIDATCGRRVGDFKSHPLPEL